MELPQRAEITASLESALDAVIDHIVPEAFFEVGAYEASFSRRMKEKYPAAAVIALEANPRVFSHFSEDVLGSGVKYMNIAAGAETGQASFFIPERIKGKDMPNVGRMGSLLKVGAPDSTLTEVSVATDRLDNILHEVPGRRTCLWIDVEGAIDSVLDGAGGTLERTALLYCELETFEFWENQVTADRVKQRILSAGFTQVARDCQKRFQYNALFLKNELIDDERIFEILTDYTERVTGAV